MFGLDVKVPFSLVGTLPPAMAERRGCPNVCIDHSAYLEHAETLPGRGRTKRLMTLPETGRPLSRPLYNWVEFGRIRWTRSCLLLACPPAAVELGQLVDGPG